uniref:Uncharacterized protein n=1 Tax=Oryza rufipogon TaxID=4529 RepID=A0A0E0R3T7_ORYRU
MVLIWPSPSESASWSMSASSSSERGSPRLAMTWRSSSGVMKPFWSLSKTRKASRMSSSAPVSRSLRARRPRNSSNSMLPLPSASTSSTIFFSSASVGDCPSDPITATSYTGWALVG